MNDKILLNSLTSRKHRAFLFYAHLEIALFLRSRIVSLNNAMHSATMIESDKSRCEIVNLNLLFFATLPSLFPALGTQDKEDGGAGEQGKF